MNSLAWCWQPVSRPQLSFLWYLYDSQKNGAHSINVGTFCTLWMGGFTGTTWWKKAQRSLGSHFGFTQRSVLLVHLMVQTTAQPTFEKMSSATPYHQCASQWVGNLSQTTPAPTLPDPVGYPGPNVAWTEHLTYCVGSSKSHDIGAPFVPPECALHWHIMQSAPPLHHSSDPIQDSHSCYLWLNSSMEALSMCTS